MCLVTAGRLQPHDHSRSVQARIPLSVLLITHMPVGHLSAASTDLHTVGLRQLSRFVSACLKASTAAGGLTLISGGSCVTSPPSCPDAACRRGEKKIPPDRTVLPRFTRTKSSDADLRFFCVVTTDSFSTKAPVKESEKPQLLHRCHPPFHYPLAVQRV